jgi:pyridoxamine 5'-phosphate oxidase
MNHPVNDPLAAFHDAFARAKEREVNDPTAMTLATVSASGRPSARMVLLKDADERGFTFYTNHDSRKGRELAENAFAALCIHWATGAEQVRVEGRVEQVSAAESDAYFASRARGSQIGAWASLQSRPLPARSELEARTAEVAARFEGQDVPRPPNWGGFRVVPDRIEFWFGRADRLHDRFVYVRQEGGWSVERLYP